MVKNIVALIPARSGSQRIKDKNIADFFGHPLIAYVLFAAKDSGIFSRIIVSSDSDKYLEIARGLLSDCETVKRPTAYAQKKSLDAQWILHAKQEMEIREDVFCVLRPTNPFRVAATIRRAYKQYQRNPISLRGMQVASEHPFKMWSCKKGRAHPLFFSGRGVQAFNESTQKLQEDMGCYVQNGSMEIGRFDDIENNNFLQLPIQPFITKGYEGLDINTPEDWMLAEALLKSKEILVKSFFPIISNIASRRNDWQEKHK